MSKHLERDLANLQRDLMTLASSVEEAIQKAIKSLETRSDDLAQQVIDGDHEIDCKMEGMSIGLKACFVKKA